MDFTKLISLIDSESLYFTRADKFDDPFEGSYPKINVDLRDRYPETVSPKKKKNANRLIKNMAWHNERWPEYIAINCWHINK